MTEQPGYFIFLLFSAIKEFEPNRPSLPHKMSNSDFVINHYTIIL